MKRSEVELMAPAGSYEALRAALDAGADAVYFGAGKLNMRAASAANFTEEDIGPITAAVHEVGRRAYLTVNTVVYEEELAAMRALLDRAARAGVDAVIVADPAAMLHARRCGLEVHLSTQLNLSNSASLAFFSAWADVAVLARECTLSQIEAIHRAIREQDIRGPHGERMRLECFAHGALCMAQSGRCYLSLHETGHSANRGACRQICRRSYTLTDRETGAEIATEGPYLLSPKDLSTIDLLDRLLAAGVRVLKIEGRARGPEYVHRVVTCYDEALRALEAGEYTPERIEAWRERLAGVFNRGFWNGYYLGVPRVELSPGYGSAAAWRKVYIGKVVNYFRQAGVAEVAVEAAAVEQGSRLLFTGATTGVMECVADELRVGDRTVDVAVQGVGCTLRTPQPVHRGDRLFKWVAATEG